jgi:imidazole glycerol-phosphate synthase subunit HisH
MIVGIIDYGSGNLRSVAKAFERAAAAVDSASRIQVTSRAEDIAGADCIVLPGVGAYADCRRGLDGVPGMVEALTRAVIERGRPFLGICVGMQLMADRGLEHEVTEGLGWLAGEVVALSPASSKGPSDESPGGVGYRVPHMGWNELVFQRTDHPVFADLSRTDLSKADLAHAYFVHSYHLQCARPEDVIASVNYGQKITAAVGRNNLVGTQFHPEKSQALGLALIANFLKWRP